MIGPNIKQMPLGRMQVAVLRYLADRPGARPREVAQANPSLYSASAISIVMTRLEKRGLIDGSNWLTEAGRAELEAAAPEGAGGRAGA
jgi:hypothetical protein